MIWQPTICSGMAMASWILVAVVTGVTCDFRIRVCRSLRRKFSPASVSSITSKLCMTKGMGSMLETILLFLGFKRDISSGFLGCTDFQKGRCTLSRRFRWRFLCLSFLERSLGQHTTRHGPEFEPCSGCTMAAVGQGAWNWFGGLFFDYGNLHRDVLKEKGYQIIAIAE